MGEASGRAGEITMLDVAALVTGAAVASVHFKDSPDEISHLNLLGGLFLAWAFGWLALTAAGPFVFLVRRFGRRVEGYPGLGDGLWLAFGSPWTVAALCLSAGANPDSAHPLYGNALFAGLAAASGLALWRLVPLWSKLDPAAAPGTARRRSWTERIGLVVAVTWPLQLGLVLVLAR